MAAMAHSVVSDEDQQGARSHSVVSTDNETRSKVSFEDGGERCMNQRVVCHHCQIGTVNIVHQHAPLLHQHLFHPDPKEQDEAEGTPKKREIGTVNVLVRDEDDEAKGPPPMKKRPSAFEGRGAAASGE